MLTFIDTLEETSIKTRKFIAQNVLHKNNGGKMETQILKINPDSQQLAKHLMIVK